MQHTDFKIDFTVDKQWEDFNGHMNVTGYLFYFSRSAMAFFESIGFGADGIKNDRASWFALQQQLTYLNEVLPGEKIQLHVNPFDLDEKRMHFWVGMEKAATGELIATMESMSIYVNMDTRKSQKLPEDKYKMLQELVSNSKRGIPDHIGKALGFRKKS
ncbi:acyl-CoA thioesterase [Kordiimonas laminariae]|uniref:acyl-CoA thioesterase n=1 Tax=Kordiimonas laminariae TaxID=2917717 RepID=UPI001FF57497|nr:thioesterase family protein [Kordiimonas laminariae]MCK0068541.1 thioesterase family protein [Kordiimonas laminariae]